MFTIAQIKEAHAKVKSGADFPAYIKDLIRLGVNNYESYVADGHCIYYSKESYTAVSEARYPTMPIAGEVNTSQFEKDLKEHQQGKTDFPTFCSSCAANGIGKWVVSTDTMLCVYFDTKGQVVLSEHIPS